MVVPEPRQDGIAEAVTSCPWRPIETAPTNGVPILLYLNPPLDTNDVTGWSPMSKLSVVVGWGDGAHRRVVEWSCGFCKDGVPDTEGHSWSYMIVVRPTHWMPLPAPPSGT